MTERALLTISYRRLKEIVSGLQVLKERKLPTVNAELRVAVQMRNLIPHLETYQELQKKLAKDHVEPEPDEIVDTDVYKTLQQKFNELDMETLTVKSPKKKLTAADLPQVYKGEEGERNNMGNAGVMIALAPEFFDLTEEPD